MNENQIIDLILTKIFHIHSVKIKFAKWKRKEIMNENNEK